ncbi:(2Fe-2S)-binding protein [Nocardiopsis sp. CNR-923]|uniref:(2Fe-2S)-binding protein n=1 Tax=Nocardiopsis sp. CNR-923 TaxID=1904965 RepID=UPI000A86CBE3|nr:(2Fe-2S)-binding protein [Nocardiopsis sp. CNR-923]
MAASIFHQGLAARLLSPVVAAGVCHGALLDAARFHYDPEREGPVVLRTTQEYAATASRQAVADWVEETVVSGVMERVARVLCRIGKVSPGLLRGNTAAALAGAVRSLGADRPEARPAAETLARALLERPALSGTGGYAGADDQGLAVFERTTCCLYYRLPGQGMCGDCALRR